MNKSEIFCSKSIYFFQIVCLVCVTCRRASFGTLCPPCGMIYGAIPLPYLWYWPSFVQPFSHISSFQSLNLFNLLHFSHLIIYLLLSTYFKVINYYFDILQSFFNIVQTLLQLLPIFQRFSTACITRISCSFWKCFWELLLFIVSTVQGFVYKWQWILEDFNIYKLEVNILTMCGWCE